MSEAEYLTPDGESSSEMVESAPSTLAVITQSEYAAMVATANLAGNRRKVEVFGNKLMEYTNHSQPVALSMFYTLPRAGKQIVGPSVRFAEVVAPCWKNNSTGSRMIGSTDKTVTAQGVFIDYEANMRNVKEIPRRITDKDNRKFNDDMVLMTSKAALSIAYREAVLKGGVPGALWDPAYQQAKLTAVGKAVSHAARIDMAMEYLTKLGVTEWQVCNAVGVTSPKELEIDHLVTLKALCEEIKKGVRTIEEVFGSPFDKEIESLFTQLKKNETEKRLLRNSYLGRAKELVDWLRSKLGGPVGQTVAQEKKEEPKSEPTQASQQTFTEPQAPVEQKRRGRPRKDATPPATGAKAEPAPETTAQAEEPSSDNDIPEMGEFKFN